MEKQNTSISVEQYLEQQIEFHKEQANRHLGAIQAFVKMKEDIVRANEQEIQKEHAPTAKRKRAK